MCCQGCLPWWFVLPLSSSYFPPSPQLVSFCSLGRGCILSTEPSELFLESFWKTPSPLWHLLGSELSNSRGHKSHCIPEFCPLGVHLPRMRGDQLLLPSCDQRGEKTSLHRAGLQDLLKHSPHLLMCGRSPWLGRSVSPTHWMSLGLCDWDFHPTHG